MGSLVELNDTLQITKEQGFPAELDLETHLKTPYKTEDFKDKVFEFHNKTGIRLYKQVPVRNFLVENKGGKWVYWGLVYVLETTLDGVSNMTSGKFKILYLYTPEEMKKAFELIDRNPQTQYFK